MKLIVNGKLWTDYFVYEPSYNEFEMRLDNLDPNNFIDLKKYHYKFCQFININSEESLIQADFSTDSIQKLIGELEWASDYPVYEVFEEPADFCLEQEESGWNWECVDKSLRIYKGQIEFLLENIDEEEGSSPDFEALNIIIENKEGYILTGEEINLQDFEEGTKIIGFDAQLDKRCFFSEQTAIAEKAGAISQLEYLIPLIEHKDYKIETIEDLLSFIDSDCVV